MTEAPELVRRRKPAIDVRIERQIITGMVVSDRFLKEIQPMISGFQTAFCERVSGWCLDYWKKYSKAPANNIEDIFLTHRESMDPEDAKLTEDFLQSISEEYERQETFNVEYILDKAERHFRLSALKRLQDDLSRHIMGGRIDEAEALVKDYKRPDRPHIGGVDPLRDREFIEQALKPDEENPDVMIYLPGILGQLCGPLERGTLVAFQAESGVGKTWWLWLVARIAVMAGFNVVFFSLEMREKKMARRMWQDLAGMPVRGDGKVLIPVFDCKENQAGTCTKRERGGEIALVKDGKLPRPERTPPGYLPCSACRDTWTTDQMTVWWSVEDRGLLDPVSAMGKMSGMDRVSALKKAGKFHLVEFPSGEFQVGEMKTYLNNLEYYDGFVPDLVVTDYADKFRHDIPGDPRVSIGLIWGAHKGLAQARSCLVVTASQSNTERSGKRVGKASWAENIEKRRMIDLGIAFNQKASDLARSLMFASVDKIRDGEQVWSGEVAVLQQLSVGKPYLDSCLVKRGEKKGEKNL